MAAHKIEELNKDVAELRNLVAQSGRQRSKDVLGIEIRKVETELSALRAQLQPVEPTATAAPAPDVIPAAQAPATGKRYRCELTQYAFDQSDKFVKLFVTLDGVEKCREDQVRVDFAENSLTLTVEDVQKKDHQLQINNLLEPIDVAKSHRKIKPGMVVIYAKKVAEGNKWSDLTVIERRVRESKAAALASPDPKSKAADGDMTGGLMDIMAKMYNSGDAQTKQMINKAWSENQEKRNTAWN